MCLMIVRKEDVLPRKGAQGLPELPRLRKQASGRLGGKGPFIIPKRRVVCGEVHKKKRGGSSRCADRRSGERGKGTDDLPLLPRKNAGVR